MHPLAGDREPRKQVVVRLRPDLMIEPQICEGRTCYVIKDPISLRYYQFHGREYCLLRLLDGRHSLAQAQQEFDRCFPPQRTTLEEIEGFAQLLLKSGLAYPDAPGLGALLFDQQQRQRRRRWLQSLTDLLYIQIPLIDPDRFLEKLLRPLRWIFTRLFFCFSLVMILAACCFVAGHWQAWTARWPSFHEFFSWHNAVYLWLALGLVKILHELGHGLTCKAFGGEVHDMGLLFLCLSPCLYCNVTDAWKVPGKWRRMLIGFAGIHVELLIASVASWVWWHSPAWPLLNHLAFSLMLVCGISTLVVNANPLLRYDGYYILSDWLEIPNLRERAIRLVMNLVLDQGLGIDVAQDSMLSRRRRTLLLAYGLASHFYRWLLTACILWFFYHLLKPYRLGVLVVLLAGVGLASMIGWPLARFLHFLRQRGGLPAMKPLRLARSAILLGAGLAALMVVPLPISRVRQKALVEVRSEAVARLFLPATAVLERVYVQEGQEVQANDLLAECRSIDLENQLADAQCELDIRQVQLRALRELAAEASDERERSRIEVARALIAGESDGFVKQVETLERTLEGLVLRAPRAGMVLAAPRIEDLGKLYYPQSEAPLFTLGDPSRLRAVMPVSPANHRLLADEMAAGSALPATIRQSTRPTQTWEGSISQLPPSEATEVPLALTNRAGGPLAVAPTSRPDQYVPQSQQYLVLVDWLDPTRSVFPGTLVEVRVPCRWRSCGWWLKQTAAEMFAASLY
jgi:putative peptide zinc metalloprotease protein